MKLNRASKYLILAVCTIPVFALFQNSLSIGFSIGSSSGGGKKQANPPKSQCNETSSNGYILECFSDKDKKTIEPALNHLVSFPFLIQRNNQTIDFNTYTYAELGRMANHDTEQARASYDMAYMISEGSKTYASYLPYGAYVGGFKLRGVNASDAKSYFGAKAGVENIYFYRPSTMKGIEQLDSVQVSALLVQIAAIQKEVKNKALKDTTVLACGETGEGASAVAIRYLLGQYSNGIAAHQVAQHNKRRAFFLRRKTWPDKTISFGQAQIALVDAITLQQKYNCPSADYTFIRK